MCLAGVACQEAGAGRADQAVDVAWQQRARSRQPLAGFRRIAGGQRAQTRFHPRLAVDGLGFNDPPVPAECGGLIARLGGGAGEGEGVFAILRRELHRLSEMGQRRVGVTLLKVDLSQLEVPRRLVAPLDQRVAGVRGVGLAIALAQVGLRRQMLGQRAKRGVRAGGLKVRAGRLDLTGR